MAYCKLNRNQAVRERELDPTPVDDASDMIGIKLGL